MSPVIEASEIKYRYGSDWVLNGLSLALEQGEIVGIIGPNGSGKTTVLKLLSKTLKQESGSIRLMGRNIASMKQKEIAKIVAVVPQGTSIAFPFTVTARLSGRRRAPEQSGQGLTRIYLR